MTANESKQAGAMLLSDGALAEIAALDAPWRDWGDANPGTVTALCQQRRALLLHVQAMSQQLAAAIAERSEAQALYTALQSAYREQGQELIAAREALREAQQTIKRVRGALDEIGAQDGGDDAADAYAHACSILRAALARPSPASASAAEDGEAR